ncbi:MAG: hypothetical protein ABJA18_06405 [bacterium]
MTDETSVQEIELSERGVDEAQAASLRARLATFAEDWELPEMEAYDALPKIGIQRRR